MSSQLFPAIPRFLPPPSVSHVLWCVAGGDYATLQAAVNAASSGDTILVGPNLTGWGDVTFPAQKIITVTGLSAAAHTPTIQIGKVTYSPTVGTANENNIFLENLYVSGDFNGSQGVLFAGTAPARLRVTGLLVSNVSTLGGNGIVSNNSGSGSSLYIDNCLTNASPVGTMLVHTQGFTQMHDTELNAGAAAFSCAAGNLTVFTSRIEYALAGAVGVITGGTVTMTTTFIRNTQTNGSGVSVASPGVFILDSSVFDVRTGTGYCVSGTGVFLYGQVTWSNVAAIVPRNVKTQNTLTQAQMTQTPTPSP